MKVAVPPLDSALPTGHPLQFYFIVLGAVYFMKVAVSPLDPALPTGQPLQCYFLALGAVYLMKVTVSPLDPALPKGQPLQNPSHGLGGCLSHEGSSITPGPGPAHEATATHVF